MTKDNAILCAKQAANKDKEPYCACKARNGQWMRERKAFVETKRGQELYSREVLTFYPEQVTQ